ncbi:hypothetical protein [Paenibacillus chitinolyticus]
MSVPFLLEGSAKTPGILHTGGFVYACVPSVQVEVSIRLHVRVPPAS